MKVFIQVLTIWTLFFLTACHKDAGYQVHEYVQVKVEDVPENIDIPAKAWDQLEFKDPHAAPASSEHGPAPAAKASTNFIFSEVNMFLVEKNEDVLTKDAIQVSFPRGGGSLDLASYMGDHKGSFYVGFDFPSMTDATAKKVLFISAARKRKIGGQIFGAGCNQFFDITDQFFKAMKGEGLKVNTTQERHLSVLGGVFIFAAQKGNDVHLAQITIKNSKFPQYFCEGR